MAVIIADLGEHYIVHLSGEEVCMYACMHVFMYVCMCACMHVCVSVCVYNECFSRSLVCALFLRSPSPVPPCCRAAVAMRTGVQDTTHHCRK